MPGSSNNKDVVQELLDILRQWEDDQNVTRSDPTSHLIKLCELFERETINFLKKDPDPFDDRHPVTSQPDCALGQILRALFKKDTFVTKLVSHYLRDNYFSTLNLSQSSLPLNTAACRLLLDILHGLDIPQVFRNSEAMVSRLYTWAESAEEPIASYSIGLLAAAMDIEDLPTVFRDNNARLVPILLNRLWELKNKDASEDGKVPERPFAHLGNEDFNSTTKQSNGTIDHSMVTKKSISSRTSPKRSLNETGMFNMFGSPKHARLDVTSGVIKSSNNDAVLPSMSPSYQHIQSDCSNSSWAEMSSYIVGTYQMYPMNSVSQQMFILKYLRPVGEYQEVLGHIYEYKALDLIFHYMNFRHTNNARLSFESLRFLGSLLFHKKFCLEFVNIGGVEKLLQVPRPSLPSGGVALCLWYLAFCEEAVEKICVLPDTVLDDLICYALWLLESSHQSSSTHAVMFFGMVFKFRALLEKFDEQDGLRKMLNKLSTMTIFQAIDNWDQEIEDEPNEIMMWQTVKQVCLSVRCYLEAHLALRVMQMQRSHSNYHPNLHPPLPSFKAMTVTAEAVEKNVEYLLENFPFRARWKAVEHFINLKGLKMFLQLVAIVFQDSYSMNRTETAESTLGSLYVCSVVPVVQAALCEKFTIPPLEELIPPLHPEEVPGYAILVACIPENTEINTTSSDIQKACLSVLINCVCAPIHRAGSIGNSKPVTTPCGNKRKFSTSEEIINKCWDCVRTSNGIMYLLNLLHKKAPITDADEIRALACRALVGLSRSDTARQIMSKLPVFTSGQLQLLMREPVLQDKRIEHGRFQRSALELIKAISGRAEPECGGACPDITISSIHKADVVAQTKIDFNKKQLLQLIQNYLSNEGYDNVATVLQKEASLPPLPQLNIMGPPSRSVISTPSSRTNRHLENSTGKQLFSPLLNRSSNFNSVNTSPVGSTSLQIKINKKSKLDRSYIDHTNSPSLNHTPPSTSRQFGKKENHISSPSNILSSPNCNGGVSGYGRSLGLLTIPGTNCLTISESGVSLEKIVTEYLTSQHALCKNPVVTCPTFDLFQPHRCPEPKAVRAAPNNFTMRYMKQPYLSHRSSYGYAAMNRKYIYSRYRPSQPFKSPDNNEVFLVCEFMADDQTILVGTNKGEIRMFNKNSSNDEGVRPVHDGAVSSIVSHKSGNLLLTSSSSIHESSLWSLNDQLSNKFTIPQCEIAFFSNKEDRILGSQEQTAKLYDVQTNQEISTFTPKLSNHYIANVAALDPTDELLLNDGVLFDVKSGKQIHKFDKINPLLNGVFHRNGLEIISSSEIWDLRTFHLLRTVPSLNLGDVSFNHTSDVIFGVTVMDSEGKQQNAFETSFTTIDASSYESIATVDVRKIVSSLAINPSDTQIAIVEKDNSGDDILETAVVRLYDIGMTRHDTDELIEDDDDDDLGSEDDDSDDTSDDPDQSQNNDNNADGGSDTSNDDANDSSIDGDGISIFSMDDDEDDDDDEDGSNIGNINFRDLLGYFEQRAASRHMRLRTRRRRRGEADRNNSTSDHNEEEEEQDQNDNDNEQEDDVSIPE